MMFEESVQPGDRVEVRKVRFRPGYISEEIWMPVLACTPPLHDGSIGVLHSDGKKEMVQSRNWRRA